jgi:hypothetical protein
MITETDEIAEVLDGAAARWPDSAGNRPELIRRILLEQLPHVVEQRAERIEERRQRIRDGAGVLSGVWPVTWRDELRSDWHE